MPDTANSDAPAHNATRGRFRFREYRVTTVADPMALPVYEALCVTGEERNCGAESGTLHTPDELTRWIAGHCAQTGHQHYEQTVRAILRAEPGAWQ
ncbi:hypothetical protein HRW14_34745 [Streptomyces lunaelactis]|uniref:DUF7848 domain-containing protein n=1 Tax=Streptomyces lunaelactis TaxID=1535768 RepID=UPI0015858725|nr:hypothetical protein [Streptomyces lunaelactis]NUK55317.1 hypothetical protein [Streptomyces lunaelactis]NUK69092.1 hypothetical protein [Streptomyces lunaelactis]